MMKRLFLICCVLTAMVGTVSAAAQGVSDIRGFWRVVEVRGIDKPDPKLAVQIRREWFWLLSPCWQYGFPLRVESNRMEVGPSPGSMNCRPNGVGDPSAEALKAALPEIASFAVRDGRLVLLGRADEKIAMLTPLLPSGVENRWWGIEAYRWGLRLHKLAKPPGAVAFVDGSVLGNVGCFDLNGTYALKGDQIDVSSGASLICPQGQMELPKEIMPRLQGVHRLALEGDRLTLTNANGKVDIVFEELDVARLDGE
jgi:hypothetical protein